ncbi:restriction endonuclease subunit S [Vibrio diabolicus]|uniref:restriction endonuclease subunit S n=1 Tax=Vibrio diabolicus TaxID=50719 RepID=UPI00232D653A|nr:restriction endonuclease subunit S [Vibrio diabolicus]
MSEMNFPSDWVKSSISDIAQVNPKKIDADPDTISGFVPMALAPISFSGSLGYEEKLWREIKKSYTNFQNDDVIFAKVTPCFENGKAAIVKGLPNGIGAGSSEFYVLRPHAPHILPQILLALIKTQKFASEGAQNMTGAVGLRRVPRAFVESFSIPVIPIAEQKVIAEKLDTLLVKVEATKARLESSLETLKQFRQSVLAAAVSGKLTEDRVENFNHVKLSDVATFQNGFAFKSGWFKAEGEFQVVKLGNIREGRLALENAPAFIDEAMASEYSKFMPNAGDSLISMTGTRFKKDYGFSCLVEEQKNILINQRVGRIIPECYKLSPMYLNIILRSEQFRNDFFKGETGGVNQGNVGSKHIMSIEIDVPDLDTQNEIVRKVQKCMDYSEIIEKKIEDALERVNNLTISILAKAFRGELTKQWREDNPELVSGENSAEVLLEKIKAERVAAKPKRKVRKKAE